MPPAFGQRSASPFCLKAEMALTHLGFDFTIQENMELRKSPKRKPWLEDNGKVVADSDLVLRYLNTKTNGGLLDQLSPQQRCIGTSFVRLAEDHLYWLILASRWLDDDWFVNIQQGVFGSLPAHIGWLISRMARMQMRFFYRLHDGLGRHCRAEQIQLLRNDLDAIAGQVCAEGFITGPELCVYDFGVAAMLATGIDNTPETWVSEIANGYTELRDYAEKVQERVGVYSRFQPHDELRPILLKR